MRYDDDDWILALYYCRKSRPVFSEPFPHDTPDHAKYGQPTTTQLSPAEENIPREVRENIPSEVLENIPLEALKNN
jgi:hypothetical protein